MRVNDSRPENVPTVTPSLFAAPRTLSEPLAGGFGPVAFAGWLASSSAGDLPSGDWQPAASSPSSEATSSPPTDTDDEDDNDRSANAAVAAAVQPVVVEAAAVPAAVAAVPLADEASLDTPGETLAAPEVAPVSVAARHATADGGSGHTAAADTDLPQLASGSLAVDTPMAITLADQPEPAAGPTAEVPDSPAGVGGVANNTATGSAGASGDDHGGEAETPESDPLPAISRQRNRSAQRRDQQGRSSRGSAETARSRSSVGAANSQASHSQGSAGVAERVAESAVTAVDGVSTIAESASPAVPGGLPTSVPMPLGTAPPPASLAAAAVAALASAGDETPSTKAASGGDPPAVAAASGSTATAARHGEVATAAATATSRSDLAAQARLIHRISKAFTKLSAAGGQVRMRLHPEHLGSVQLEMRVSGRNVEARVTADNEAARSALQQQLSELRQRLESQGLQVQRLEVELSDPSSEGGWARDDASGQAAYQYAGGHTGGHMGGQSSGNHSSGRSQTDRSLRLAAASSSPAGLPAATASLDSRSLDLRL